MDEERAMESARSNMFGIDRGMAMPDTPGTQPGSTHVPGPFGILGRANETIIIQHVRSNGVYTLTYHFPTGFCVIGCQAGTRADLMHQIEHLPRSVRDAYDAIFAMLDRIQVARGILSGAR